MHNMYTESPCPGISAGIIANGTETATENDSELRSKIMSELGISTLNIEERIVSGICNNLHINPTEFDNMDSTLLRNRIEEISRKPVKKASRFSKSPFSPRGSVYLALNRFLTYKPW